eukprot:TRINITY_DN22883_c0_g1_i1.p1 TRINITY_DN22883_c0_g1~~TRINITY_DN22883_c0_g1_i1.p1  ORF type:complete len:163 (-),score=19.29 TRINITY_DN22883_c0_g1_i1:120-608(-)
MSDDAEKLRQEEDEDTLDLRVDQFQHSTEEAADLVISGIKAAGELSETSVRCLAVIFDEATLLNALDLVDRDCVSKYLTPSGRYFFQVTSQTRHRDVYRCFEHYCPCYVFQNEVLRSTTDDRGKNALLMCKHQLAIRLADALGKCKLVEISNEDFSKLLVPG